MKSSVRNHPTATTANVAASSSPNPPMTAEPISCPGCRRRTARASALARARVGAVPAAPVGRGAGASAVRWGRAAGAVATDAATTGCSTTTGVDGGASAAWCGGACAAGAASADRRRFGDRRRLHGRIGAAPPVRQRASAGANPAGGHGSAPFTRGRPRRSGRSEVAAGSVEAAVAAAGRRRRCRAAAVPPQQSAQRLAAAVAVARGSRGCSRGRSRPAAWRARPRQAAMGLPRRRAGARAGAPGRIPPPEPCGAAACGEPQ